MSCELRLSPPSNGSTHIGPNSGFQSNTEQSILYQLSEGSRVSVHVTDFTESSSWTLELVEVYRDDKVTLIARDQITIAPSIAVVG